MKLTIKEIRSAMNQRTLDGGCQSWRNLCDNILPEKSTKITKQIAEKINSQLSQSEIAELKSII